MPKRKEKDILGLYLEEIGKIPLLKADEEVELAKKIEQGDENARQQFIKANLRLVVSIARRYVGKSLNLTLFGLIHEGNFGLLQAVKKFDWRRGYRFSTYAIWWIRKVILEALCGDMKILSLDAFQKDHEKCLYDFTEDKKAVSPSDRTDQDLTRNVLKEALLELDSMAQRIISMSFGLEDGILYDHKEIATELCIKKEKVRQIKAKALKRLKQNKKLNKFK